MTKTLKKDDGTGSKVEEGGAVNFEGGQEQKPDQQKPGNLEQTINNSGKGGKQTPNNLTDIYITNMTYLSERAVETISEFEGLRYSDAKPFLPYFVEIDNIGTGKFQVHSANPKFENFNAFIQHPSMYGPGMSQTGIMDKIKSQAGKNNGCVTLDIACEYFPEIEGLKIFYGSSIQRKQNPYIHILSLPIGIRPFFAGALGKQIGAAKIKFDSGTQISGFYKPLTFKQIKEYAEDIGAVSQLGELMEKYNQ